MAKKETFVWSRKKSSPYADVVNIDDLRLLARRRLPKAVFDYLDGGAENEITLHENCRAFHEVIFRPRHAVAFRDCQLAVQVLGSDLSFPVMLAPVGYSRLMHPSGEVGAARVAGQSGIGYILSTVSGYGIEKVRAATRGPLWYQLYLVGGRETAELAIDRAHLAGFDALVLTVDTPVAGMRERDQRNGMKELLGRSLFAKLPYIPNILGHPRWLARYLADGGLPKLENIIIPGKGPMELVDVSAALSRAVVTWEDLPWIRKAWPGPIVIKGILTRRRRQESRRCGRGRRCGIEYGGRQLDCVSPSLRALPEVISAVKGQVEVLMDGGVRRGSDIIKAICLGARAVLVGRAYAYGLGAGGEAGVSRAVEILREGTERTLRLLGCPSVLELDCSYVSLGDRKF